MRPWVGAAVVAGAYAASAGAYIVASGWLAERLTTSAAELALVERLKGLGFIAVTSLALFGVWLGFARRLARQVERDRVRERALLNAQRQAELGLFAGSVAHDVNNALFVLTAGIDALARRDGADRHTLDDMQAAIRRATTLTRRLGIGRGAESDRRAPVDLLALVKDIVRGLRHHPALAHVAVTVKGEGAVVVDGDPDALGDALANLVLNAGEAVGGEGRVEVVAARRGAEAVVEVHDDGPGVPVERVPDLFEAFSTTKPRGTGLGLFSVRGCAATHGGTVAYTRSPLGGACFRLALPVAEARGKRVADRSGS